MSPMSCGRCMGVAVKPASPAPHRVPDMESGKGKEKGRGEREMERRRRERGGDGGTTQRPDGKEGNER